jgi:integrase
MARMDLEKRDERLRSLGLKGKLPAVLTERVVEAVRTHPTGERFILADGKVPGLALAVNPDGAASWLLQARSLAGNAIRHGLGSATAVSLDDARDEAQRVRTAIREGRDPVAEKRAARVEARASEASTVRAFLDTYAKEVLVHRKSGASAKDRILASWAPILDVPLAQLTREKIEKVLSDRKALTAPDGSRLLANATLNRDWATFRPMLEHARRKGVLVALPITGKPEPLRGLREEPRRRYLGMNDSPDEKSRGGEMQRFLDALDEFKSDEPGGGDFARVACIVSLNTGIRRGEFLQLTDDMLKLRDLGNERIELPGKITKSGKPRDLYLNPDAIAALKRWIEVRGTLTVQGMNGELFPGKREQWEDRLTQRHFRRIRKAAGIKNLIFKDLRCTYASLLVQGGTSIMEVQKILGHYSVTITEKHYAYLAPSAGKTAARAFRVS